MLKKISLWTSINIFLTLATGCNKVVPGLNMVTEQHYVSTFQVPIPPSNSEVSILVKKPNGKTYLSYLNLMQASVGALKEQLQDTLGIPVHAQRLTYQNRELIDRTSLLACHGIGQDSILDLACSIKGGGGGSSIAVPSFVFADIDFNKKVEVKIVYDNALPSWITIKEGLNIAAVCPHSNCISHKHAYYVWIPQGKATFDMAELILIKGFHCSACGKEIDVQDVKGISFFNCSYAYDGIKLKDRTKLPVKGNVIRYENTNNPISVYEKEKAHNYFGENWTIWATLKIVVK